MVAQEHSYESGWVVKLPFTTNRFGVYHCLAQSTVCSNMICAKAKAERSGIPYCMLQPRLGNLRVHKVSLLAAVHQFDCKLDAFWFYVDCCDRWLGI